MKLFRKEWLLENWILKITAILLAWVLWFFIQGEPETVTRVDAPVEIQIPAGMEISSDLPSTVQVTMRGARQALTCNINLMNAGEGEHRITLTEDHIKSPKGSNVEVSQVNPPQIVVMLEKTVTKEVPITVPVQGEVADGFEVYEKIPDPNRVTITGPRSHIEPVKDETTEIIDLNGQKQSENFRVRLDIEDALIRSSISGTILVKIRVGPRRKQYVVKKVPLTLDNEAFVVTPRQIDIEVMAPEMLKDALIPGNFRATIRTQGLESAALPVAVKPEITFLEGSTGNIKIAKIKPSEIKVSRKEGAPSRR
jgi:YbbR domain-containing protein